MVSRNQRKTDGERKSTPVPAVRGLNLTRHKDEQNGFPIAIIKAIASDVTCPPLLPQRLSGR